MGQEEEEQDLFDMADVVISVTSLEEVLVTQMLPEPSAAIPAGVNPKVTMGQSAVVAQEVASLGISITPFVTTTQTLFEGSTAMSLAFVVVATETFDEAGGVKGVEGRELPPPPPPPPMPQEERRRRATREKEPKRRVTGVPPIPRLLRGRCLSRDGKTVRFLSEEEAVSFGQSFRPLLRSRRRKPSEISGGNR